MAHNLNYNNSTGKHSFFTVKEKAWHGLGTVLERHPTSAEAIKFAGLDYSVEKRPLFTYDSENVNADPDTEIVIPEIGVPNYFATVRTDTDDVLGVVGNDYQIVQNIEAFSFFDEIVGGGEGIIYETAGALGKGERIFITAKLPGFIQVGRNDLIEKYIFLSTSHDGLGSITAAFTPVRIVCQNTLNAALSDMSNVIRIRHTANAAERLKQAHKVLGLSNKLTNQLDGIFNGWAKCRITDKQVLKLVQLAMAPSKEIYNNLIDGKIDDLSATFTNKVDAICEYAFASETQQGETTKGTLFGAYNAITGYFQNVKNYKTEEQKLKTIIFGSGANRAQTAFNLCAEFRKNANSPLFN